MIRETLADIVTEALNRYAASAGFSTCERARIEYPAQKHFGDYASPVAMEHAKAFKRSPMEIANGIAETIASPLIEKVDIAPPGFINIVVTPKAINEGIHEILASPDYAKGLIARPTRILLEFVSANPTGPLHIGHGRWAAIGDTLARILRYAGHEVDTEFYVNDAGVQIERLNETIRAVRNGEAIPEDGYHGAYIEEIAKMDGDPKEIIREGQEALLSRFGVCFTNWASEKAIRDSSGIEKAIDLLKKEGYIFEKEGALWFRSTAFGDDKDRVLKKSDGEYTYFAADIAYHADKVRRGYDTLINVLGADHHGYVPRLTGAVEALSKGTARLIVIIGQLVRLFRGKELVRMSKRTGDMISLEEVIDEIGADSTRYFLIMRSANTALDFDLELAKKQDNDNPVYYLQYAYARMHNIFAQREEKQLSYNEGTLFDLSTIDNEKTRALAKALLKFPDVVLDAARTFEPHRMANYLYDTAAEFHRFYYDNVVLDYTDETARNQRLQLVRAAQRVFAIGFDLIGISKKERM